MTNRTATATVTTLAALSLLGTLSACAPATPAGGTDGGDTGTDPNADTSASYKDGTYDASGEYQSPNGTETIGVSLTLAGDKVTAVTVTPNGTNPNTVRYQGEFRDGIAAVVVGKDIDTLKVSRVAGSSLTSGGFNEALTQIKADALE